MPHIVAPSILAADFSRIGEEVELVNQSSAEWIHIDIMDGRFVPNISMGFPILSAIRKCTSKYLDVHLMVEEPDQYIPKFKEAGADGLTVHYEACTHLHRTIQYTKECGMKAGVVINPATPVSVFKEIINDIDVALIMSVNPGFGGQKFIASSLNRIAELKQLIIESSSNAKIEVDGGVGPANAEQVLKAGADVIVAGSAVFKAEDPKATIETLKSINTNNILA